MPPSSPSQNRATSHSVTRHILVILAIAVFITAMALIILQNVLGTSGPKVLKGYDAGYAEGFRDARAQYNPGSLTAAETATGLSGRVSAISGNVIELDISGSHWNEKVDGVPMKRTVTVASDASIVVVMPLSPADLAGQNDDDVPMPQEETVSLSDVKVGDFVTVSAGETDILRVKSFTATKVVIHRIDVEPAVIPPAPAPVPTPAQ